MLLCGTQKTEITVQFSPKVLSYDGNGFTTDVPDAQVINSANGMKICSLKDIVYGYSFVGWSSNKNAAEAEYYPGMRYINEESTTLYAICEPPEELGSVNTGTIWQGRGSWDSMPIWYKFTVPVSGRYCLSSHIIEEKSSEEQTPTSGIAVTPTPTPTPVYIARDPREGVYTKSEIGSEFVKCFGIEYNYSSREKKIVTALEAGQEYYLLLLCGLQKTKITVQSNPNILSYNGNGFTSAVPAAQSIDPVSGTEIRPLGDIINGHTFTGWSSNPSATVAEYYPGMRYYNEESLELYAVFEEPQDLGNASDGIRWKGKGKWDTMSTWYKFTVPETGWYQLALAYDTQNNHNPTVSPAPTPAPVYIPRGIYEGLYKKSDVDNSDFIKCYGVEVNYQSREKTITAELEAGKEYYLLLVCGTQDSELMVNRIDPNNQDTDATPVIMLPGDLQEIDAGALSETGAEIVIVPENVERIAVDAFTNCPDLRAVYFEGDNTVIEDGAFPADSWRLVISGHKSSTAYDYAMNHYIEFVELIR